MLANKCSTTCSNNILVSPSPTPAEPRNIIGTIRFVWGKESTKFKIIWI